MFYKKHRCVLLTTTVFLIFLLLPKAIAQQSNNHINVPHAKTTNTYEIDGYLNEEFWQNANTIKLDIVNSPWDNSPSPVKTEAKLIENGQSLFVAFIAYDPQPENILANYGDRDSHWDDDIVGLKIDSQNSLQLNYEFVSNPVGEQMDGIFNRLTGEKNTLWDGIWHSAGRITEHGYIVEIEIPLRILNFESSQDEKTWPIELFRAYPRETWLRISHVPLDKNIACKVCQYPSAKGFKLAKTSQNILLTPAVVVNDEHYRDLYQPNKQWQYNNGADVSLDARWALNSNNVLNATINPDFSIVEADSGQLDVNQNFALFYDEKRPFFLENSEFFSSNFDLVYTRNIVSPDYGAKFTGNSKKHTYGFFLSNDQQTNILLPGNLNSDVAILNTESKSAALSYRYNYSQKISLGLISTFRHADNYHNYVLGVDGKYQFNNSNSLKAQWLTSNTQYPLNIEQAPLTDIEMNKSFSDQAFQFSFEHNSQYWQAMAKHQKIDEDFRADLGFMPNADFQQDDIYINRRFYAEQNAFWQEANINAHWLIKHNEKGELIEKTWLTNSTVQSLYQSIFKIGTEHASEVGLRHNQNLNNIDNNTTLFSTQEINISAETSYIDNILVSATYAFGKEIDYKNNRLANLIEWNYYTSWFVNKHLELEFDIIDKKLSDDNGAIFHAQLLDTRISYHFNINSTLKFSIIYYDIEHNQANNPLVDVMAKEKELSTQLIYTYQLNPQTAFYLGYSDSRFQDDNLFKFEQERKTFFSKITYAWLP